MCSFPGRNGFFPSDYVEMLPQQQPTLVPQPMQSMSTNQQSYRTAAPASAPVAMASAALTARVLFAFAGSGPSEMPLAVGEVIEVVRRGDKGGWSKGSRGAFPTDYVEFLPQAPLLKPAVRPSITAGASNSTASVDLLSLSSVSATSTAGNKFDAFAEISTISSSATSSLPPAQTLTPSPLVAQSNVMLSSSRSSIPEVDLLNLTSPAITTSTTAMKTSSSAFDLPEPDLLVPTSSSSSGAGSGGVSSSSGGGGISTAGDGAATASAAFTARPESAAWKPPPPDVKKPHRPESVAVTQAAAPSPASAPTSSVGGATTTSAAPTPAQKPSPKPKVYAVVKYNREAQGPTELTIKTGEVVWVQKQDSEWWYGSTLDKKLGFFPGNYVLIKDDIDPNSPETYVYHDPKKPQSAAPTSAPASVSKAQPSRPQSKAQSTPSVKPSSSKLKLPGRGPKKHNVSDLVGAAYALEPTENDAEAQPVWYHSFFLDLFADPYRTKIVGNKDPTSSTPAIGRMKQALHVVLKALQRVDASEQEEVEGMDEVLRYIIKTLEESYTNVGRIPAGTNDATRFFTFLATFMERIRVLSQNESMMIPCSWMTDIAEEHAVLLLVTRQEEGTACDYTVTVVNTAEGPDRGLQYHASHIDCGDGAVLRNVALELAGIPNEKIYNTAFW